MPIYKCDNCNYSTIIKTHYTKHLNTKKHLNKIDKLDDKLMKMMEMNTNEHKMNTNEHKMSTNEHKMNTNEHKMNTNEHNDLMCQFCYKLFNTIPSRRRHGLHFCKNNAERAEIENKYKKE